MARSLSDAPSSFYPAGYPNKISSPYPMSNDEFKRERLHLQHNLVKCSWKGNFIAPVEEKLKNGATVLDVGCGPCLSLLELSTTYPKSNFIGLDTATPRMFSRPPNLSLLTHNVFSGLPFPDNHFDFVYQRLIASNHTIEEWKIIMKELVRVTKTDGWIELIEMDGIICGGGRATKSLSSAMKNYLQSKNMYSAIGPHLQNLLLNTGGLTDIDHLSVDIPIGKKNGRYAELALLDFASKMNSLKSTLLTQMDITNEHYDALIETLIYEANKQNVYWKTHRVIGRKNS
ncbi:10001_t:CDS:2 [Paraglomus brasilianum]|uniref:10001_t:CDS:1 n=1 Tax=Paraglomus brasilianum TaxID=144538 RepID=A0A9N9FG52_9GLOM|nr:10001_t:CDS:2 [Paraglomus brasilianum]